MTRRSPSWRQFNRRCGNRARTRLQLRSGPGFCKTQRVLADRILPGSGRSSRGGRVRLGVSGQLLSRTHTLLEIVDVFQSLDVDAIEFWPRNLPGGEGPEEEQRYEKKDVAGTRRLLQERGMDVACVTLGFSILSKCKEAGAVYGTDALKGAVDAAAELGAPIVNCYLAGIAPELFVAAAQPAAEHAGTVGVTIVLENEAHDDSGPAASLRSIVEAIG